MIKFMARIMNSIQFVLIILIFSSCSNNRYSFNEPLKTSTLDQKNTETFTLNDENEEITVVLTFSGGGIRAAAFSYGVMQGLKEAKIKLNAKESNVLSNVDIISSVSGGSFTAAYYGLFGDDLFVNFEDEFLKSTIQSQIKRSWFFNPLNWFRFISGKFNRSDLITNRYQKDIFKNKTFTDMKIDHPQIIINATDLSTGSIFSFTEESFRWICSDLGQFSVAKAVLASAAVPVIFSPITLKNYTGCDPYEFQLDNYQEHSSRNSAKVFAKKKYLDKDNYKYLHLVDGGVSDNLGVRSLLNLVYERENNFWQMLKFFRKPDTKKVIVIAVNAAASLSSEPAKSAKSPGLSSTLMAVTNIQSSNFNMDTLDMFDDEMDLWEQQVKQGRCKESNSKNCDDIEFYLAELNFEEFEPKRAKMLSQIKTSLQLEHPETELLIQAGKDALKQSVEFNKFLSDLK